MGLPAGTLNETYQQRKALLRTRAQWLLFIVFLVFLFALPLFTPIPLLGMLNIMGIFLVAVLGLQIIMGYCGLVSLGQAAFMGIGAFFGCLAAMKYGTPLWASFIIGGLAASLCGLIFAAPAIRVKGMYLAITTMAFQFIFHFVFMRVPKEWLLGMVGGFNVKAPTIMGVKVTSEASFYWLIFSIVALVAFFTFNIIRSRFGRAFMAIRDNDLAAEVMGINIFVYKLLAFVVGTFFAGIAGVLWGFYMRYVNVEQFTLFHSVWMVGMLVVGGLGRGILGAIVGTIFLRSIQEIVNVTGPILAATFPQLGHEVWWAFMNFFVGLVIVLFLIFEPRGLAHRWEIFKRFYRLWPFPY